MPNSAGGVVPVTNEVRAWGRVLVGEYVRYPHPTDRVVRLKLCALCYKSGRIMQQADGIPITKREWDIFLSDLRAIAIGKENHTVIIDREEINEQDWPSELSPAVKEEWF